MPVPAELSSTDLLQIVSLDFSVQRAFAYAQNLCRLTAISPELSKRRSDCGFLDFGHGHPRPIDDFPLFFRLRFRQDVCHGGILAKFNNLNTLRSIVQSAPHLLYLEA